MSAVENLFSAGAGSGAVIALYCGKVCGGDLPSRYAELRMTSLYWNAARRSSCGAAWKGLRNGNAEGGDDVSGDGFTAADGVHALVGFCFQVNRFRCDP